MRMRELLGHVVVCVAGSSLLVLTPALKTGYLQALISGSSPDTISSATVALDQPSGTYLVYINTENRSAESVETWKTFFLDYDNFTYSMEDIACAVARGDTGAQDMAASLQSLLPEHQMQLTIEDPTMLLSRMAYGKYDMVVFSQEFVDAKGGIDAGESYEVLEIGSGDVTQGAS